MKKIKYTIISDGSIEQIRDLEFFTKYETDALYEMVNDFGWRESMWEAHQERNKNMLYKQFWTSQKVVMEYLFEVWHSEPSLYADCVKNVVTDKKALRELAKKIIPNL